MKTFSGRALSERDRAGMREMRDYAAQLEREQREREDREQYRIYTEDLNAEQAGTPPALRVPVLSFETWAKYLPADETDPVIRRTLATFASLQDQNRRTVQKQAEGVLSDETLAGWGFDLSQRPAYIGAELQGEGVNEAYYEFQKATPSFEHATDWDVLQPFMARNRLTASLSNLKLSWDALVTLNLVPERSEPSPAPARKVATRDPEIERAEAARQKYRTEIVVTDPDTGETFTQHQLDHVVSADRFKELTIGKFKTLTMRDVIDPWIK